MGKLAAAMNWAETPLGPIGSWPQSLRTTVSLCLASNFPISLAWGPSHIQIYNDGYWPICGAKQPSSMGQDFRECWASAWPVIGAAFEQALAGETSYLENQRMFLDRNGYLEETFFTFSFSPIRDESGGVGGLFHPVTETTPTMLAERRTRALRDLAARTANAATVEQACTVITQVLAEYTLDVPFVLLYVFANGDEDAQLAGSFGVDAATAAAWPSPHKPNANESQVEEIQGRLGGVACGPYPEPPRKVMSVPIAGLGLKPFE